MGAPSDVMMIETEVRDLGDPVGRAVFTTEPIEAGRVVAVFGGRATTADQLRSLPIELQAHSLQVEEDVYLVSHTANEATLINHSCDPTCRLDGQVVLVATRDLGVGDPLTFDYATCDATPYDEFECACGTALCRGKVTGDDWMRPELQQRYDGWFSPYIERKIAALHAVERDPSSGLVTHASGR